MQKKSNVANEKLDLDKLCKIQNEKYGRSTTIPGVKIPPDRNRIPFGIFAMDYMSGGGIPVSSTTCMYGPKSGAKTSKALSIMRMVPKLCFGCFYLNDFCKCSTKSVRMKSFFVDIEGTMDSGWAEAIGCPKDTYYVGRGDYGEMSVNLAVEALKADDCGLVVFDSLGALVPEAIMEAPSEDQFYAAQAKLITRCVHKVKQTLIKEMKNDHPCAVIFINQKRAVIGGTKFSPQEKMPGGYAMEHEFSLLFRCVMKSLNTESDVKFKNKERSIDVANRFSVSIKKNKIPVIQGVGEYIRLKENMPDLNLKKGQIDDYATVLTYAKKYGIIDKNGAKGWKYFNFNAKKQIDIINIWKQKDSEYFRCQREIIDRAKRSLQ